MHGFGSGTFTWAAMAAHLVDEIRLVAWDRPPFGRSDRPPPGRGPDDPYGPDAELEQTATIIDQLVPDDGPVVLVGHSAGALLAVRTLLAERADADAAVLIAPALTGEPPPLVRALGQLPGTGTVGPAVLRVALLGAGSFLRAGGRHRNAITDATAAETARTLRRPGTATAMWHLTRTWTPPTAAAHLADLDVPVTVIAGADDRIIPLASLRDTVDAPGWDVHVLDGVGHAPQEQAPERVAELVRGVIVGLGRRR